MEVFEYTGKGQSVPRDVVSVRFHPSVIEVEEEAFAKCIKLREVVINDGVEKIGKGSFMNCISLGSIKLPSTVTEISCSAFYNCDRLKEVVVNKGLMEIGNKAFYGCTLLESINFPSTLIKIGNESFSYCITLRCVVLCKQIQMEGTVGQRAFGHCNSLESIDLFSTANIRPLAFANCNRLRELNIYSTQIKGERKPWMQNQGIFYGCISIDRLNFITISSRFKNIIRVGHIQVENKVDEVLGLVEKNGHTLFVSNESVRQTENWNFNTLGQDVDNIMALIVYYESKEATTLFELALWKAKLDQSEGAIDIDRWAHRIEVPGPIKDTILQYLGSAKGDDIDSEDSDSDDRLVAEMFSRSLYEEW